MRCQIPNPQGKIAFALLVFCVARHCESAETSVRINKSDSEITISAGDQPIVKYVYQDKEIPRPYFKDLKTPNGIQVSRNHPPRPDTDATDHATFHPGLWLAFGDMSGQDSWRLKAKAMHSEFLTEPNARGDRATFAVVNRYETSAGETICRETGRYDVICRENAWLLLWDSTFTADKRDIVFGDQEEMGLGVRMATPLTVKNGGEITNSAGDKNEKGCWGKPADWCDYSGMIGDSRCGVLVMGHKDNFKRCSFHARDYGFVAANPFAEKAFGRSQQPAKTVVKVGESLRLQFGILIYGVPSGQRIDGAAEYSQYLKG